MSRRMGLAALDFGIEHESEVGDPVGVDDMAGTPGLGRVVADLGTVLMTVEQLDGGIDVEYPADRQGLAGALGQGPIHPGTGLGQLGFPGRPLFLRAALERRRQVLERTPKTFVADDLAHAQYPRRDAVAAQSGDVRVAPLPVQNRQQPGAQHIPRLRRVRAGVGHRTVRDPAFEQSAHFEKFGKERQLPQRRGAASFVPAHLVATTGRCQTHLARCGCHVRNRIRHRQNDATGLGFAFTHRVTPYIRHKPASDHNFKLFGHVQVRKIG